MRSQHAVSVIRDASSIGIARTLTSSAASSGPAGICAHRAAASFPGRRTRRDSSRRASASARPKCSTSPRNASASCIDRTYVRSALKSIVATVFGEICGRRTVAAVSVSRSQRFFAYGLAGWCSEVVTTGLRSRGRDDNWRLTGTTYLWMLPIYGAAAVAFEPAHDAAGRAGWPGWQRAAAWTAGIYAVEAASGELIRQVSGEVPWDYSRPRGRKGEPTHWRGLVRPAYAPVWFAVGLGLERLHGLLERIEVAAPPGRNA